MRTNISFTALKTSLHRIAILDDPTAGLSPDSRREFWNLLFKLRQTHTILLSTRDMAEAETIADRILVMNDGKILHKGSSLELKALHNAGYVLRLVCEPHTVFENVMTIVKTYVPEAYVGVGLFLPSKEVF